MNRVDIIQTAVDSIGAKTYLEIGVRSGESFLPIICEKKIGVDPYFVNIGRFSSKEHSKYTYLFEETSDKYFENHAEAFDVAFIDGLHTYEQSLRDASNCLKWMNEGGLVILHDCNPTSENMTNGKSPDFTGDVWKTIVSLRSNPFLRVCVLDCDYGVGVVSKGFSNNHLNLSIEDIAHMSYSDLENDRKNLLNLIAPEMCWI